MESGESLMAAADNSPGKTSVLTISEAAVESSKNLTAAGDMNSSSATSEISTGDRVTLQSTPRLSPRVAILRAAGCGCSTVVGLEMPEGGGMGAEAEGSAERNGATPSRDAPEPAALAMLHPILTSARR